MSAPQYRALRIHHDEHSHHCELTQVSLDDLSEGGVVLATEYSAINYKDALAGTGSAPILRKSPLVGGIDAAGCILESDDPNLEPGQIALVTGCGLSETRDGGYCERLRVPPEFVVPIPDGFTHQDAMILGTAGLTAMLSIQRFEDNGITPDRGPVLVTGASGGVGSLSVLLLNQLGYTCIAMTSKDSEHEHLRSVGADEIWTPEQLQHDSKGLGKSQIAAAIDNLGGNTLPALARITQPWGCVVSIGVATGMEYTGSVAPFVIRGISILGVTSANCPPARRQEAWRHIFQTITPESLNRISIQVIDLNEVSEHFQEFLDGQARGRTVVRVSTD